MNDHNYQATILLVDDVPTNINVLLDFLNHSGFEVLVALDGESALELVDYYPPDIILLDVMMPNIDGFETCRRLKANPATQEIPVIFLTALSDIVDKVKGFEIGAVDYITKPLQCEEVLARVTTHLTVRNLQKELQKANEELEQRVAERTAELLKANVCLKKEIAERQRAEQTLRAIVTGTAAVTGDDFFHSLVRYLAAALEVSHVLISEYNPSKTRQRTLAYWQDGNLRDNFEYDLASPLCKSLIKGEICFYPDKVQQLFSPLLFLKNIEIESFIGLPLCHTSGHILGCLAVFDDQPMTSQQRYLDILKIFAARAGAELERKQAEEERQLLYEKLRQTNRAYSRFVPKEFLRLLKRKEIVDVQLGDQIQMDMTVLFADIRSFTTLSEQMSPQDNFNFINTYLHRVGPIIRQHHGFIDKYIGDGIMALFPTSPDNAIQAALAMQKEVARYNQRRTKRGHSPIQIGIGLHTGTLMLGTIGEEERMEGTVISDAVNLASRMEGLTKFYQADIIISNETFLRLKDLSRIGFRFLGEAQVKGKQKCVGAFEVFDPLANVTARQKWESRTTFEQGVYFYQAKMFIQAKEKFNKLLAYNPEDKTAHNYLNRVNHLINDNAARKGPALPNFGFSNPLGAENVS